MSAMSERAAEMDAVIARASAESLLARLPSCDCFDPECGYPHGRNRIGKHDEILTAILYSTVEYGMPIDENAVVSRDDELAFRIAVMDADARYHEAGAAGTKSWLRDFLVPQLAKCGLRITRSGQDGTP